ncbi:MAG: VWA domain-containing protein, partial [Acidobacteriota bacterium]|nr:VWA domain-containing protein [Acidobacteriota bacterium]
VSAAAQPQTVIRVDVNLVHAVATVKNQAGQLVGDLNKSDFEVYDNGVKQEIAVFEHHTELPLSVALEIDTSGSTAKELKYESDAASRFARALLGEGNPEDTLSLYTFNWRVTQEMRFTRNLKGLDSRLKSLEGDAGTALYDALVFGARDLEERDGRKAIIVVTDGGNTVSKYTIDDALQAAHLADTVIYSVVVVPITNEAGRNIGGEHALQILAERTGGKIFFPAPGPELDKVFADIIRELRTQYMIGFYPKDVPLSKERFHRLAIRTARPDLQVSARNGYYGAVADSGEGGSPQDRISVTPDRAAPPDKTPPARKKRY